MVSTARHLHLLYTVGDQLSRGSWYYISDLSHRDGYTALVWNSAIHRKGDPILSSINTECTRQMLFLTTIWPVAEAFARHVHCLETMRAMRRINLLNWGQRQTEGSSESLG